MLKLKMMSVVAGVAMVVGCEQGRSQKVADEQGKRQAGVQQEMGWEEMLSDITQLTSGFARAGEAYFSRDMQWMIFQASVEAQKPYQMYVARLEWEAGKVKAGKPVRISPENSRNTCGYFSPDGKTVLFASTAGKERPEEPTGGYQRQGASYRWEFPTGMEIFAATDWQGKLSGEMADLTKEAKRLTNNEVYDAEGSYSADGKWIVYTHGAGKEGDIYIMRADGTHSVQITRTEGYDGGPFFSPDGKRLVYRSDRRGNDLLQVFTCDLTFDGDGNVTGMSNEKNLSNDENVNWGPSWYPDGKHIIYATSVHGHQNYELYLMRDDGSGKKRVTFTEGADILPVFSPDGKYLMWAAKRAADKTTQIFIGRFEMR